MTIKFISKLSLPVLLICTFISTVHSQSVATVVGLRTEYLENPLGIDARHPRFTWRMMDGRQGAAQTSYEITVGTDANAVAQGRGNVWVVNETKAGTQLITYQGTALQPFTKYYWAVRIADHLQQKSAWSSVASFETGMMEEHNWTGAWISDGKSINEKSAPYFRTEFIAKRKIKSARAYIAAAGLYELYLNGEKVGNHRLDPMYTRFDRRVLYVT
ncbi:MAG: alpha-rhamnosidase, partial [Pedobacter sp.]